MTKPTSPYSSPVVPTTYPAQTNVLAVVAVIAAVVLPLIGIVLGVIARIQIRRTGEGGGTLAIVAIIIGAVLTVLSVIALAVIVVVGGSLFCWGATYCVV